MTRTRAAAVGGGLFAMLAMTACGVADQQPARRAARPSVPAVSGPDLAVERLHRALDAPPTLSPPARNPFRFGGPGQTAGAGVVSRSSLAPLPPPDGLPVLPLPLPQVPLRLLGLVTFADGAKVAVISVGSDLVLARTGEVLAGRYRVGRIGEEAVDLTDAVGERPIRLALP